MENKDGFIIHILHNYSIIITSRNVHKYTGYSQIDFIGKSVLDFIHPEDKITLKKQFLRKFATREIRKSDKTDGSQNKVEDVDRALLIRMKTTLSKNGKTKCIKYKLFQWTGKLKMKTCSSRSASDILGLVCLCHPVNTEADIRLHLLPRMVSMTADTNDTTLSHQPRIRSLIGCEQEELSTSIANQIENTDNASSCSDYCHTLICDKTDNRRCTNWIWLKNNPHFSHTVNNQSNIAVCTRNIGQKVKAIGGFNYYFIKIKAAPKLLSFKINQNGTSKMKGQISDGQKVNSGPLCIKRNRTMCLDDTVSQTGHLKTVVCSNSHISDIFMLDSSLHLKSDDDKASDSSNEFNMEDINLDIDTFDISDENDFSYMNEDSSIDMAVFDHNYTSSHLPLISSSPDSGYGLSSPSSAESTRTPNSPNEGFPNHDIDMMNMICERTDGPVGTTRTMFQFSASPQQQNGILAALLTKKQNVLKNKSGNNRSKIVKSSSNSSVIKNGFSRSSEQRNGSNLDQLSKLLQNKNSNNLKNSSNSRGLKLVGGSQMNSNQNSKKSLTSTHNKNAKLLNKSVINHSKKINLNTCKKPTGKQTPIDNSTASQSRMNGSGGQTYCSGQANGSTTHNSYQYGNVSSSQGASYQPTTNIGLIQYLLGSQSPAVNQASMNAPRISQSKDKDQKNPTSDTNGAGGSNASPSSNNASALSKNSSIYRLLLGTSQNQPAGGQDVLTGANHSGSTGATWQQVSDMSSSPSSGSQGFSAMTNNSSSQSMPKLISDTPIFSSTSLSQSEKMNMTLNALNSLEEPMSRDSSAGSLPDELVEFSMQYCDSLTDMQATAFLQQLKNSGSGSSFGSMRSLSSGSSLSEKMKAFINSSSLMQTDDAQKSDPNFGEEFPFQNTDFSSNFPVIFTLWNNPDQDLTQIPTSVAAESSQPMEGVTVTPQQQLQSFLLGLHQQQTQQQQQQQQQQQSQAASSMYANNGSKSDQATGVSADKGNFLQPSDVPVQPQGNLSPSQGGLGMKRTRSSTMGLNAMEKEYSNNFGNSIDQLNFESSSSTNKGDLRRTKSSVGAFLCAEGMTPDTFMYRDTMSPSSTTSPLSEPRSSLSDCFSPTLSPGSQALFIGSQDLESNTLGFDLDSHDPLPLQPESTANDGAMAQGAMSELEKLLTTNRRLAPNMGSEAAVSDSSFIEKTEQLNINDGKSPLLKQLLTGEVDKAQMRRLEQSVILERRNNNLHNYAMRPPASEPSVKPQQSTKKRQQKQQQQYQPQPIQQQKLQQQQQQKQQYQQRTIQPQQGQQQHQQQSVQQRQQQKQQYQQQSMQQQHQQQQRQLAYQQSATYEPVYQPLEITISNSDDEDGPVHEILGPLSPTTKCLVDEVEALLMEQERQDQLRHEYYHQYG